MEEETIEVTFNSKSIQMKMKKNSSTGLTDDPCIGSSDAWRKDRRPVGLSSLDASRNQVNKLYSTGWTDGQKDKHQCNERTLSESMFGWLWFTFSTGWSDASETTIGALDVLCSRKPVWVDRWTSSAPVEPMPLQSMHRCNDTSLDTVSESPMATIWTQRDRLNRRLHFLTRRFFRWSRFFCSGLPTAMWPSPLYIRAPLGSFKQPFDALNTWSHPWEEERVHWAKEWWSRAW